MVPVDIVDVSVWCPYKRGPRVMSSFFFLCMFREDIYSFQPADFRDREAARPACDLIFRHVLGILTVRAGHILEEQRARASVIVYNPRIIDLPPF